MKHELSRPPLAARVVSLLAAALLVTLLFWVQFGLAEHYDSVGVTALVGARASFLPLGEFTGALGALARVRSGG